MQISLRKKLLKDWFVNANLGRKKVHKKQPIRGDKWNTDGKDKAVRAPINSLIKLARN